MMSTYRTNNSALLKKLAALACLLALVAPQPRAQVRPVYSQGAAGILQMLGRLKTTASLLHTAAHPDDEDTALISRLARGDHARVAYLSVTRGEGGQNVLGPELGEALGVIRTEELLAARALDGGGQFFTRAFDYGFSKALAEAREKWDEQKVLADMVRLIRACRPLVITSRFSGRDSDGHGQHQFAGYITPIAFRAAADPRQFPEQLAEGLRPWQAKKYYISEGFRSDPRSAATLRVETGIYDPLLGRTYYEIAAEGRSQHRSQEMGSLELRGSQPTGLRLIESVLPKGKDQSLFDGIDTSLRALDRLAGLPEGIISSELAQMDAAVDRAINQFHPLRPQQILPALAEGLRLTRQARAKVAAGSTDAQQEADFLLARKEREFQEALRRAAGVEVDALADTETVVPGESLRVSVRVFMPEPRPGRAAGIRLRLPQGWKSEPAAEPTPETVRFRRTREATPDAAFYSVEVPASAEPTQPYFLEQPRDGYLYRWDKDAPRGLPFAPPLITAEVDLEIAGARFTAEQPVRFRYADDIRGELRPELNVVPALSVALDPTLIISPISPEPAHHYVAARTCNHSRSPVKGTLRLDAPLGWTMQPAAAPFSLQAKNDCATSVFTVTVPPGAPEGSYPLRAQAAVNGQSFALTQQVINYPHIRKHRLYSSAATEVRVLDLHVAPVRVGYIMGSGDQVPEAIRRMGLRVTLLDERDLAAGDLSRFDTIVVGIKAAQVRPDLIANHGRLMDFVRQGGTLIVQFQQQEYLNAGLPPFSAAIDNWGPARARVSREDAPVKVLQPQHPAFTFPNAITAADFDGWVHERSLYNFTTFAPEYLPLLESADPAEPPQRGGQLYVELGKGKYVYTSYAWFRQLPAGVPGAYRLFANLLSLPKAPPFRPTR